MTSEAGVEVRIREAVRIDMAACASIVNDWIDATDWMPRMNDHTDVARYYETEVFRDRTVLVCIRQDRIAGFLNYDSEAMITALYVLADLRGCGIGKQLLDAAKVKIAGPISLWTYVLNVRAQTFYERERFVEVCRDDGGDTNEKLAEIQYLWSDPA
jgi:GNAT superfamily N-acetyltransferase